MQYKFWSTLSEKRKKRCRFCFLICFCWFSLCTDAQNKSAYSFSGFCGWGRVIPTNDFVRGKNSEEKPISELCSYSLRLTRHTSGEESWHSQYDYPSYGIGLFKAVFNVPNQLGEPTAFYFFLTKPIFKSEKYTISGDYAAGVAFNWLHFSLQHPERTAMGGAVSCYLDATLLLTKEVSDNLDFSFGLSLSHFSNGAMKKPNFGINTVSAKLAFDYFPYKKPRRVISKSETFDPHFVDLWSVFAGAHNEITRFSQEDKPPFERRSYCVLGIDRRVVRRFNIKHSLGAGCGIGYDRYAVKDERFNFSAYLCYEYRVHRVGLIIEPGIYLYKSKSLPSPQFFQRIGLRYYLNDNYFAAINLRAAYFSVAQYIEWSVGCALPNFKAKNTD